MKIQTLKNRSKKVTMAVREAGTSQHKSLITIKISFALRKKIYVYSLLNRRQGTTYNKLSHVKKYHMLSFYHKKNGQLLNS